MINSIVGGKLIHAIMNRLQAAFAKDVHSLVSAIEDLGNPFEEESTDLLVLVTKKTLQTTVQNAQKIGQGLYHRISYRKIQMM
jgi:hypothetical protein